MGASGPHTLAFAIRGPIARTDLPGLCDRICALLTESRAEVVICDVCSVDVDAVTVDALARLQLAARRRGSQVRLLRGSVALCQLVEFMGLANVLCTGLPGDEVPPAGVCRRLSTS
jgi:ABC-type transporter Mla MlaB component